MSHCRIVALSRCRIAALSRCRVVALSRCRLVALSRCCIVASPAESQLFFIALLKTPPEKWQPAAALFTTYPPRALSSRRIFALFFIIQQLFILVRDASNRSLEKTVASSPISEPPLSTVYYTFPHREMHVQHNDIIFLFKKLAFRPSLKVCNLLDLSFHSQIFNF